MNAIQQGRIEILQRRSNCQPKRKALEIALRQGHLDMAKWLHQTFLKLLCPGLSCSRCSGSFVDWCDLCKWKRVDLETAQWVFSELEWKDQSVQMRCMKRMALAAAANGDLDVIKFLLEFQRRGVSTFKLYLDPECFEEAAANGHLSVVRWLHDQNQPCTSRVMDAAARNGHLGVVQWLHLIRSEGFSTHAIDDAARNAITNGHLHVLKWLHENRTEGCTSDAMDLAARDGHLEVIKWLHGNRNEGCTTQPMDNAAANGHLEVLRWLHENRSEGCTTEAMDRAASYGQLDTLRFLHENRSEGCTRFAQVHAVNNGRLEIFKWLHENRSERCSTATFLSSMLNTPDHFDIIEFAAHYSEYIRLHTAVSILLKRGRFEAVESILRDAHDEELVSVENELLNIWYQSTKADNLRVG